MQILPILVTWRLNNFFFFNLRTTNAKRKLIKEHKVIVFLYFLTDLFHKKCLKSEMQVFRAKTLEGDPSEILFLNKGQESNIVFHTYFK